MMLKYLKFYLSDNTEALLVKAFDRVAAMCACKFFFRIIDSTALWPWRQAMAMVSAHISLVSSYSRFM